jgi:16S rRNA (guanine527-N7)-methyltransferase
VDLVDAIRAAGERVALPLSDAQQALLGRYVELLFKWNRITNLIGPSEVVEFVEKHLTDCLSVARFVRGATLVDVGSGAGLPGLVLACIKPELRVFLVETRAKRARFLETARIALALPNVEVVTSRIEHWQPTLVIDTLICRAFGTLAEFVRVTAQLQQPGCRLLAMKGQDPVAELAGLATDAFEYKVHTLDVPGWRTRHLVELVRRAT